MSDPRIAAFVERLQKLHSQQDRGALAALRRAVDGDPAQALQAARYVYPYFPEGAPRERWMEKAFLIAGGLFALHPVSGTNGNLGRHLREAHRQGDDDDPGKERRLLQLLAIEDREDLAHPLRQAVAVLPEDAPVNWEQLLEDLIYWGDAVKRRWARGYWGYRQVAEVPTSATEEPA
jgi:CRISPR type I-E-associated protein CasB/Cse2